MKLSIPTYLETPLALILLDASANPALPKPLQLQAGKLFVILFPEGLSDV